MRAIDHSRTPAHRGSRRPAAAARVLAVLGVALLVCTGLVRHEAATSRVEDAATVLAGPVPGAAVTGEPEFPGWLSQPTDPAGSRPAGGTGPAPAKKHHRRAEVSRAGASRAAALRPVTERWSGYAFDACRAPSRRVMDRWRVASPFRGVGIYIGGVLRACAQKHLTPSWVRHQTQRGWKLLPIWVGPQASCTSYSHRISGRPGASGRYPWARAQGERAARGAIGAARRLGIRPGPTLWYDLEFFPTHRNHCRRAAIEFLGAWTRRVHRAGYASGVYSSVSAGIKVLGQARGIRRYDAPDHVWFAWANGRRDTWFGNEWFKAPRWKQKRRVHQYALDVTASYGGVRMRIDRNFVDLGTAEVRREPAVCGRTADRPRYPTLHRGSRGPSVRAAHCLLAAAGHYKGKPASGYDRRTWAATRSFQRRAGLRATGRLDDRTWTALLAAGPRQVVKRGSEGPAVRRAQRALTAALPGRVAVHGHFGPGMTTAVRRYQQRAGLRETGVVGPRTWRALASGVVARSGGHGPHGHGKHGRGAGAGKHGKHGKRGERGEHHKHSNHAGHPKRQHPDRHRSHRHGQHDKHGHSKHHHGHQRRHGDRH